MTTGKHIPVLDKDGKPVFYDKWRGDYIDHKGRRRIVILGKTKPEARKQLDLIEAREREIKLGLRPVPSTTGKALKRKFRDVANEYIAWGRDKGPKGKPWSTHNLKKREYYLAFWEENLKLTYLSDILDCLGEAETIIQDYKVFGKRSPSPRTRHAFRESLFAFCGWCIWKKYLENNPFEEMSKYKPTPQTMRRAMTEEEIRALLAAAPIHRKMVYETAFMTGFRVGELRSLTIDHIDRVRNGIHLKAVDDKAGLARFQIVTEDFIQRLYEYGRTGDALTQYKISHARARKPMRKNIPENPLLYLPVQTSVMIYADLKKAGIPIKTMEGKVDFHACRTTFINMVIASGADIKTLQETARHERAETSLKYYARVNPINLQNTAKALAKAISSSENHVNCTKSALIQDDGEETKNAIPFHEKDCAYKNVVGRGGFEPP